MGNAERKREIKRRLKEWKRGSGEREKYKKEKKEYKEM